MARYRKRKKDDDTYKILIGIAVAGVLIGGKKFYNIEMMIISIALLAIGGYIIIKFIFMIKKSTISKNPINQNYKKTKSSTKRQKTPQKIQEEIYQKQKRKQEEEKSNKQLGDEYEIQIGKFYEDLDYKVEYRGINLIKKDKGIDLIVEDEDEMLLIQCKNNQKSQIKQYILRKFIGDCQTYKENNNINKKIRRIFVVAKNNLEYGAKKYIKENKKSMEFEVIPYKND